MGDDYDYEDDGDFMFEDPDYIYAEESFDLADELASNTLPNPNWTGVLEEDYDDYDMYEYFEEIEYGNDDYYDKEGSIEGNERKPGDKRKSLKGSQAELPVKRRKVMEFEYEPVLWMPFEKAYSLKEKEAVDPKSFPSYSLLPDWRERFLNANGFDTTTSTKPHLRGPVEVNMEENGEEDISGEGEWEDEEEEEEEEDDDDDDEGDEMAGQEEDGDMTGGLDPEILKSVLAAKLSETGMSGLDQGAFMESIMQMISGGGTGGDDAMENLLSTILGQVSEGGADSSTSKWLSREGVKIPDEEEEELDQGDGTNNADSTTAHGKKVSVAKTSTMTDSPKDSVAESDKPHNLQSTVEPLPPTSVPEEHSTVSRKRKDPSFGPSEQIDPHHEEEQREEVVVGSVSSNKRPKREVALPQQTTSSLRSTKMRNTKGKAGASVTMRNNQAPSPQQAEDHIESKGRSRKLDEPEVATKTGESKKRKAATTAESDTVPERPKRQLRNFAAPTASSQRKVSEAGAAITKKTTRSGKEKK